MRNLAIAALAIALTGCAHERAESHVHAAPSVTTATVRIGDYDDTVPAIGRVGGVNGSATNLSFAVAGIVNRIYVRIGERVSAGEPLASLDARGYELASQQAHSDVSQANATALASNVDRYGTRLAIDRAALQRETLLYNSGVAARKDVDAARAQLAQDRAEAAVAHDQLRSNEAAVQSAQMHAALADRDLNNSVLRAPEDGTVAAILRREGESVDSSAPVVTLTSAQNGDITLSVAADALSSVRAGDPVQFTVNGENLHSEGVVTGISTALDATTQTGTVVARGLPVAAPLGSVVQASIVVSRVRGIVVPESAVVQDPQTGNSLVFVATPDKDGNMQYRQQVVNVRMHNGSLALVSSGLRPGQHIASRGGFTLLAPADSGGD
ncbi:MAG TPA: HlyD family efflux transporter periplasmic adaptor subunit [Candidatus Baltobacteraceae bacterium]|jgi:macrolide-specific efflux system membrane fusion protein|nr:HlyD family efflux transporter periplasmic adaptor subunit [Candidatus Baltobacteraceae bacterium]